MELQTVRMWAERVVTSMGLPAFILAVISVWWNYRLQCRSDRLRSDLQQGLKEHEVRFSSLHARRVAVLGKLYRRLLYAHSAYMAMTSVVIHEGEPTKDEKERLFWQKWMVFKDYFNLNRIWLDKEVCEEIDNYAKQLESGTDSYAEWKYNIGLAAHLQNTSGVNQDRAAAYTEVQEGRKPLSDLLNQLISRFRVMLGMDC